MPESPEGRGLTGVLLQTHQGRKAELRDGQDLRWNI